MFAVGRSPRARGCHTRPVGSEPDLPRRSPPTVERNRARTTQGGPMWPTRRRQRRAPREERLRRRAELIAEAGRIDAAEQESAARMAAIRTELGELREQLWPGDRGRAYRSFRRPRVGGPEPVGPPAPNAVPLWGRHLRYAALAVIVRADRPLTLPEIHRGLHLTGFRIVARNEVKRLADALGYEHRRGRARRVERGKYAIGALSPARRRRVLHADPTVATASRPRRP